MSYEPTIGYVARRNSAPGPTLYSSREKLRFDNYLIYFRSSSKYTSMYMLR